MFKNIFKSKENRSEEKQGSSESAGNDVLKTDFDSDPQHFKTPEQYEQQQKCIELYKAASDGNDAELMVLIRKGADVNYVNSSEVVGITVCYLIFI
jgi:hypothetical protein